MAETHNILRGVGKTEVFSEMVMIEVTFAPH